MSKEREKQPDPGNEDRKAVFERLRQAREYLGFSQDQVATILGVSRSALSLIGTGQRKVEVLELKKMAAIYKRQVGYFTGEEGKESFGADVKHLARKVAKLSTNDRKEVDHFADFLRARKKSKE